MRKDAELARRAERQYGIFSLRDVTELRFTEAERRERLESGRWQPVHDNAYRVAGAPRLWKGDLLAACWAGGFRAAASHRSALALMNLPGGRRNVPEIVTPRWRRARHDGVVVHETTVLSADDVTGVDGIPVTTPARTLVDAAAVLHPSTLDIAVDEALRRDLVTFDALWTRVAELGGRGRAGTAHLRAFLAARHPDADLSESVRETLLVDALVAANLPRPVLQQEIRDRSGTFVARVDAAYPHARVALEYDSYLHHGGRAKHARDLERRNRMAALGWHVISVTGPALRAGAADACRAVRALLQGAA